MLTYGVLLHHCKVWFTKHVAGRRARLRDSRLVGRWPPPNGPDMCNLCCRFCSPCLHYIWMPKCNLIICCKCCPLRGGVILFALLFLIFDILLAYAAYYIAFLLPDTPLKTPPDPGRTAFFDVFVRPFYEGAFIIYLILMGFFVLWGIFDLLLILGGMLKLRTLVHVWVIVSLERYLHIILDVYAIMIIASFIPSQDSYKTTLICLGFHFGSLLLLLLLMYPRCVACSFSGKQRQQLPLCRKCKGAVEDGCGKRVSQSCTNTQPHCATGGPRFNSTECDTVGICSAPPAEPRQQPQPQPQPQPCQPPTPPPDTRANYAYYEQQPCIPRYGPNGQPYQQQPPYPPYREPADDTRCKGGTSYPPDRVCEHYPGRSYQTAEYPSPTFNVQDERARERICPSFPCSVPENSPNSKRQNGDAPSPMYSARDERVCPSYPCNPDPTRNTRNREDSPKQRRPYCREETPSRPNDLYCRQDCSLPRRPQHNPDDSRQQTPSRQYISDRETPQRSCAGRECFPPTQRNFYREDPPPQRSSTNKETPRRSCHCREDSPPRRRDRYREESPPRKNTSDKESRENTPPRRRNTKETRRSRCVRGEDSPPRHRDRHRKKSPPQKNTSDKESREDTPPRRRNNKETRRSRCVRGEDSPPRRKDRHRKKSPQQKNTSDEETPRKNSVDRDSPPPRRDRHRKKSPQQKNTSDEETPRKDSVDREDSRRDDNDRKNSPPRKNTSDKETPPTSSVNEEDSRYREDSPPRKRRTSKETPRRSSVRREDSPPRRSDCYRTSPRQNVCDRGSSRRSSVDREYSPPGRGAASREDSPPRRWSTNREHAHVCVHGEDSPARRSGRYPRRRTAPPRRRTPPPQQNYDYREYSLPRNAAPYGEEGRYGSSRCLIMRNPAYEQPAPLPDDETRKSRCVDRCPWIRYDYSNEKESCLRNCQRPASRSRSRSRTPYSYERQY